MKQQDIYLKDITRHIEGVIKAGDENNISTEINEYVITAELAGKSKPGGMLPGLFNQLAQKNFNQCVWISGDFGSGKSHLLKILSYVLENRLVDNNYCAELFADKAKDIDFELEGNIRRAAKIPTQCILFNIQANHDGIASNIKIDPILNVFLKVFNEKLGYDKTKPALAEIERHIDRKGKLQFLYDEYRRRFGKEWIEARKNTALQPQKLGEIYAEIEGVSVESATQTIQDAFKTYTLDIDGFADMIKAYLDTQTVGSRLIFCVDEVGQFIANDVQRMLSLQTIAEALVTKTAGRAFMMVTSQVDINATIGDLNRQQKHDFSRIQGRFSLKIPLTSANADEVIQKRILLKNEAGNEYLAKVFEREQNNIKVFFNFGESSQFKTEYRTVQRFQNTFPFMAYQFDLLQQSIIELNKNNAFIGNQQSVGERSMLAITQQIAKEYKDKDLDHFVQFGDMFTGIRDILQVKIQSDILQAERSLGNELALKVLKALFLVKYVKGFHSTVDNITKIMLPTFHVDFIEFKEQIQVALNKLEQQSYIERAAGDEYHFLTNEEKDIENAIKSTDLAPDAAGKELSKILFTEIYSEPKIRINNNPRLNYSYGRFIDEVQDGREQDFYLHFFTPMAENQYTDSATLLIKSMQYSNHLIVALGEDKTLGRDLIMYLKAEKCLNFIQSAAADEYKRQIIIDKRKLNAERRREVVLRMQELISDARLYIAGQELTDITARDIRLRISGGLQQLVTSVYTNLRLLTKDYDENTLRTICNDSHATDAFGYQLEECDSEVLGFINRNKQNSVRSTVKGVVDLFKSKPYGWYDLATVCILAKLFKMNKLSFRYDGSMLEDRDLVNYLTASARQANIIIDLEEAIPESQVRKLKTLFQNYFGRPCTQTEAKAIHKEFIEALALVSTELLSLKNRYHYKFTDSLIQPIDQLQAYCKFTHPYVYTHLQQVEDKLLDDKEDILDPVTNFVNGPQFAIFEQIVAIKQGNQANLKYVDEQLKETIEKVYVSPKPWTLMKDAREAVDQIAKEIEERRGKEKQQTLAAIQDKKSALQSLDAFHSLEKDKQSQLIQAYEHLEVSLNTERYVGNIITTRTYQLAETHTFCIEKLNDWTALNVAEHNEPYIVKSKQIGDKTPDIDVATSSKQKPRITVQREKALNVPFSKRVLSTPQDVDAYVNAIRENMMKIINDDKSIML